MDLNYSILCLLLEKVSSWKGKVVKRTMRSQRASQKKWVQGVKYKVLAVDDEAANLMLLHEILQSDYDVIFAKNGQDALKRVMQKPDLIILDIMMPGMDGYEVCQRLKADPENKHIPVIFLTAKITVKDEIKGFKLGATDYITKPISPPILLKRVETQLAIYDQQRILEKRVQERTVELMSTRLEVIQRLGKAAEFKDNETGMHVIRMSHYSRLLAQAAGVNGKDTDLIFNAAPMHDIGKIGIPDSILSKPGRLSSKEWKTMQTHPRIGAEIIGKNNSSLLTLARTIALTHHERWDGSGYPQGLEGKDIPFESRIVAIADVFDATSSVRPYKKAWPIEKAFDRINKKAGRHFDPNLVSVFMSIIPDIKEIFKKYNDSSVETSI